MESFEILLERQQQLAEEELYELPIKPPIPPIPGSIWESYRAPVLKRKEPCFLPTKPWSTYCEPHSGFQKLVKESQNCYSKLREKLISHAGVLETRPEDIPFHKRARWFSIPREEAESVEKSMFSVGFKRGFVTGEYISKHLISAKLVDDYGSLIPTDLYLCVRLGFDNLQS